MAAILIVDDSPVVRMDLADTLEAAGFLVYPVPTAAEARIALRTYSIAAVVLGCRLPDGTMVELLRQIRREHVLCELPVLLLTTPDDAPAAVEHVVPEDFLGKTYDRARLVGRVRQLLGSPPARELVLVIDGDATFRGQLADALASAAFATATASAGSEGLQLAANIRPTTIVVDSALPDMDGTSMIRRLRLDPALRTTPCLLLTSSTQKETEVRAFEAGADGFVLKDDLDVILARIRALSRTAHAHPAEAPSALAPKRVLTVDDDPDYLDLLGGRLRKRGYEVTRALSGEDALHLLAQEPVDCILLDRSMAGIGGLATCHRLKESAETRHIPVIVLTASEQRDAVIESLAAGADDFVSKGSGFDVLSARVQAQLRRKQIEDEQRQVREALMRSELEASEARSARELAESRARMAEELARTNAELAHANRELETFSYSVSHDLRAPLRTISAFTQALAETLGDALDVRARDHLRRVLGAAAHMSELIDSLLELARIHRAPLARYRVDVSALAGAIAAELAADEPGRRVECAIAPGMVCEADGRLVRVLLDNLLDNAWKFTRTCEAPRVELVVEQQGTETVYVVRDNGIGFDMAEAGALFTPFQRLHGDRFPGTGIGLATARRIVERHGGRIWAEATPGAGATFAFTLG